MKKKRDKAKEGTERATDVKKKRDKAKEEAQIARLVVVAAGDVRARTEYDMARVRDALAVAKEAKRKVEAEIAHLEVKRTSLLLELKVAKDKVSSLKSQAGKDKEAIKEDYQKALEVIFAYDYGCCMFRHNISRIQPKVLDGMPDSSNPLPPEFFPNPKCPPIPAVVETAVVEVDLIEPDKDP